jgi:hypothetical protein
VLLVFISAFSTAKLPPKTTSKSVVTNK